MALVRQSIRIVDANSVGFFRERTVDCDDAKEIKMKLEIILQTNEYEKAWNVILAVEATDWFPLWANSFE